MKLRVKYCGGCNVIIDRVKILKAAIEILKQSEKVEIVAQGADVGIVVAGCHTACVDLKEIEDQARQWVIVGGDLVDDRAYSAHQLPEIIAQKVLDKL